MIKKIEIILWMLFYGISVSAAEIVSLSPSVTEVIMHIGGAEKLCGRSSACTHPAVQHLPIVGDLGKPFVESVLKNRAKTLISDASHPLARWEFLRRMRVNVTLLPAENLRNLPENIRIIGRILGSDAEKYAIEAEKKIALLESRQHQKKVRAAIIFGVDPLISCGKRTFISDVIRLIGAENIVENAGNSYFILSAEHLLTAEPDVIIAIGVPENLCREFFSRKIFRIVPAVQYGKFIFLDADKWGKLTPDLLDRALELQSRLP